MIKIIELIEALQSFPCVSGAEEVETDYLTKLLGHIEKDRHGNLFFIKKSKTCNSPKILIEAHRDEIGLCVQEINSNGFISATPCGGFDLSVLPGTDFIIWGQQPVRAVAVSTPPHLLKNKKNNDDIEKIVLDTGLLTEENVKKYIEVGDCIQFFSPPRSIGKDLITCRGLDNKASIAALLLANEEITNPDAEICFLLSNGEETTSYGVKGFCKEYRPDIAIVVDVGFAYSNGLDRSTCILQGNGPSISFTDTLSVPMSKWAAKVAKDNDIPIQLISEPGGTGTSATAIQTSCGGVPSVVLSIPLYNMHTSSEIVNKADILNTARLIRALISNVSSLKTENYFNDK